MVLVRIATIIATVRTVAYVASQDFHSMGVMLAEHALDDYDGDSEPKPGKPKAPNGRDDDDDGDDSYKGPGIGTRRKKQGRRGNDTGRGKCLPR